MTLDHHSAVSAELEALAPGSVRRDLTGVELTTMKVGGRFHNLVTVGSREHALSVVSVLKSAGATWQTLGAGSNVVVGDEGVEGWTLRLAPSLRQCEALSNGRFRVGGAASLMSLARELSNEGYSGLEFSGGIPASLGGALFMNAGAHGSDMAAIVESIDGVNGEAEFVTLAAKDIGWVYRSSHLPSSFVALGAVLKLVPGDRERIRESLQHNLAERKKRQPLTRPSSGSIFKNPSTEISAGKLIEDAGLKGVRHGGAMISELHANWIVNPERTATAHDVQELIRLCRHEVRTRTSIELHPEVRGWGVEL